MKNPRVKNRVLFVVPDVTAQKSLGDRLEAEGFEVLFAETGQKALRTIRDHLVDVVVLDNRTPFVKRDAPLEDSKTLEAITDASPFLPVVFTCGTTAGLDHATSLMADMILTRPVEFSALLDAVDTVLGETLRERAQRKAGAAAVLRRIPVTGWWRGVPWRPKNWGQRLLNVNHLSAERL